MRRTGTFLSLSALLLSSVLVRNTASAQVSFSDEDKLGSVYLSIGSISPTFSTSTIKIQQNKSGNDYKLDAVSADVASTKSGLLDNAIRLGYFFGYEQKWGVEINYNPVKYHVKDGQSVHVVGQVDGTTVDKKMAFAAKDGYYYYLNGANQVTIDVVRRQRLYRNKKNTFAVDIIGRAGVGPVMPHVLNSLDNKVTDNPQFQISGWNMGIEGSARATIMRYVFVELGYSYNYASYNNINVYDGTAKQTLTTTSFITSIGAWLPLSRRRNPLFMKPRKERNIVTIRSIDDLGGQ